MAEEGKIKFGTAISCIDGRAYWPVVQWIEGNYGVDYVDLVTWPGADGEMVKHNTKKTHEMERMVKVSVGKHKSKIVVVAGHYDCAANPVSEAEHRRQITEDVEIVKGWGLETDVVGVWVNSDWQVERVG